MTAASSGDLLTAAAGGDAAAWDALVERYSPVLWSIARGYRLPTADTADAVQTAWLRLVENIDRIKDPDRVGGWLATTVRNECLLLLRRSGRERPTQTETLDILDPNGAAPDAQLLRWETNAQIRSAFGRLGTRCRELLMLLMADPPTGYHEVSATLGIPIGSIGPTRGRCLEQLRTSLAGAGIFSDLGGSLPDADRRRV